MLNVAAWLMAGAFAAWCGHSFLKFNLKLGVTPSVVIGACGGVLGGALLAPLLGQAPVHSGDFDPLAFVTAVATGLACAIVSDMLWKRFCT